MNILMSFKYSVPKQVRFPKLERAKSMPVLTMIMMKNVIKWGWSQV